MIVAVSPYHLTTREAPAMAALLLAEQVVTMLPAPLAGQGAAAALEAASRSPRYRKFVESWQWAMPLWKAGVIVSRFAGEDIGDDVRRVCGRIERDEALAELRPFMKQGLFEDETSYLDAVSADVLKGGPDPGICVPVAAGLDRFASRHGLIVARSHPASVAQQAEARMGARLFAVGVPILIQADGERLIEVREELAGELAELRAAIRTATTIADPTSDHGQTASAAISVLNDAAGVYARAFTACRDRILSADRTDIRVIDTTVIIQGVRLPVDSVLRSSTTAARAMVGVSASREPSGNASSTLPAIWEPGDGGTINAIVVKKVGAATRRR